MEMILQGLIGNKFIDQHPLPASNAVSNKWHKMAMMDAANDFNFSWKFSFSLPTTSLEALNCHLLSIRQHAFVHITKPSLTQKIGLGKPTSSSRKLIVRKCAFVESKSNVWRGRRQGWTGRARELGTHFTTAAHHWRRRRRSRPISTWWWGYIASSVVWSLRMTVPILMLWMTMPVWSMSAAVIWVTTYM